MHRDYNSEDDETYPNPSLGFGMVLLLVASVVWMIEILSAISYDNQIEPNFLFPSCSSLPHSNHTRCDVNVALLATCDVFNSRSTALSTAVVTSLCCNPLLLLFATSCKRGRSFNTVSVSISSLIYATSVGSNIASFLIFITFSNSVGTGKFCDASTGLVHDAKAPFADGRGLFLLDAWIPVCSALNTLIIAASASLWIHGSYSLWKNLQELRDHERDSRSMLPLLVPSSPPTNFCVVDLAQSTKPKNHAHRRTRNSPARTFEAGLPKRPSSKTLNAKDKVKQRKNRGNFDKEGDGGRSLASEMVVLPSARPFGSSSSFPKK